MLRGRQKNEQGRRIMIMIIIIIITTTTTITPCPTQAARQLNQRPHPSIMKPESLILNPKRDI